MAMKIPGTAKGTGADCAIARSRALESLAFRAVGTESPSLRLFQNSYSVLDLFHS
jgi:hypothetical protein